MKIILFFSISLFMAHISHSQIADFVFNNGKIYTANDAQPYAEAIAVKDGKFIFVGSNTDVENHIGPETIIENMSGRLMMPGIHDVHMHPLEAGSPIGGGCLLDPLEPDPENLGSTLGSCNLSPNANGWIMAFGHSIFTLYEATRNPKDILDDYYPDEPMVVMEETSHSVWVNSKALELMGINSATPDPIGGHIFKDDFGEPDGILLDNAGDAALSLALVANTSIDELNYEGLTEYSLPILAKNGITSICEARTYWKRNYIEIWRQIKDAGLLTVRVNLAPWIYPSDMDNVQIPIIQNLYDAGDNMLKVSQIKLYSDGIPINATAALHEPYIDNLGLPFDKGLNYIDEDRLTNLITILELTGFDFHIHAIGDRGITEALNAIESARNTNGNIGARHRITHLEIVRASDIPRFPLLNVTADMQVAGEFSNPDNWSENNFLIGASRTDSLIPLKAFHDAGARITLSSDWDVSTVNPFVGIQHALSRSPQELPTVEEAVKAYTINGAYVMRQEEITGSIELGKLADFICVNQDIFTIPINQIQSTKVHCTYLGGDEIFRSIDFPSLSTELKDNIKFDIFPNPGNEKLVLDIDGLDIQALNIHDINGKLFLEQKSSFNINIELDTSGFSPGVYFIEIQLKNGETLSSSFVKQ